MPGRFRGFCLAKAGTAQRMCNPLCAEVGNQAVNRRNAVGTGGNEVQEFLSEDDLQTFEGWMKYQGLDTATGRDELEMWQGVFDEARERSAAPKVGLMKLQPAPGEYRYAVAIREGVDLWLALWVRRSRKPEFFVMVPRGERDWDVHASYHLDGTRHLKSFDRKVLPATKHQPLTGIFRGAEPLVAFSGYGPKSVGAVCDPAAFSSVVEIAPGVLGPRDGVITVDLVEPGCNPPPYPWANIVQREFIRDKPPWVVI